MDQLGEVGAEVSAVAVHPAVAEDLAIEEGLEIEDEGRVAERREEDPVGSAVAVAECLAEVGEGEDDCLAPLQERDLASLALVRGKSTVVVDWWLGRAASRV